MTVTPTLESGYRCEIGAERERNEDSCLAVTAALGGHFDGQPFGLYVVADGLGGHIEGHVASNTAVRAFAQFVLANFYLPLLTRRAEPEEAATLEMLEEAVQTAHEAVCGGEAEPNGGTTLTAALVVGRHLYLAHVGDSRAYLAVEGELRLLTRDHTLVRRLQEQGRLSADEAHTYQYRHVLLQALGQQLALNADTFALPLPPQGRLVLCTDGLCGYVAEPDMAAIAGQPGHPQAAADALYEAAMAAGGHDNITVVVAQFTG